MDRCVSGEMDLLGCVVEVRDGDNFPFRLSSASGDEWWLACGTADERNSWIAALTKASSAQSNNLDAMSTDLFSKLLKTLANGIPITGELEAMDRQLLSSLCGCATVASKEFQFLVLSATVFLCDDPMPSRGVHDHEVGLPILAQQMWQALDRPANDDDDDATQASVENARTCMREHILHLSMHSELTALQRNVICEVMLLLTQRDGNKWCLVKLGQYKQENTNVTPRFVSPLSGLLLKQADGAVEFPLEAQWVHGLAAKCTVSIWVILKGDVRGTDSFTAPLLTCGDKQVPAFQLHLVDCKVCWSTSTKAGVHSLEVQP